MDSKAVQALKTLIATSRPGSPTRQAAELALEEIERLQHGYYPHMCRDGHPQIGHFTDEEECPVCIEIAERERIADALNERICELERIRYAVKKRLSVTSATDQTPPPKAKKESKK